MCIYTALCKQDIHQNVCNVVRKTRQFTATYLCKRQQDCYDYIRIKQIKSENNLYDLLHLSEINITKISQYRSHRM